MNDTTPGTSKVDVQIILLWYIVQKPGYGGPQLFHVLQTKPPWY